MARAPNPAILKTRASKAEEQKDATSKAATQIIDSEMAERIAKTKRLRAERLEHEAAQPEPVRAPKVAKRKR